MTCRWITVQIQAACGFQNTVKFEQADGHHGEVGHHVRVYKEPAECLDHLSHVGVRLVQDLGVLPLSFIAPVPGIFEGGDLRFGLLTLWAVEEDVVIFVAVEGRIQVDQVDRFVGECDPSGRSGCHQNRACSWAPHLMRWADSITRKRIYRREWDAKKS